MPYVRSIIRRLVAAEGNSGCAAQVPSYRKITPF